TDTTVHTLYGNQMGARKSYNPKNKGKKSYQPILTFIAETREYIWGELRNGDLARRKTDCASFDGGVRGPAELRWSPLRPGRFRVLLLGGGASLRARQSVLHPGGPQDVSPVGSPASRRVAALAPDRRRPGV